jgi:hypothetical protein
LTSVVLTAHAWNSRSALCAKGGQRMSHERLHCGSCSSTFAIKQKRGNGRTTTILGIPHRKASRFTKRARRSAHQLSQSSKNEVNDGPRLTVQDPTWKAFIEVHKKKETGDVHHTYHPLDTKRYTSLRKKDKRQRKLSAVVQHSKPDLAAIWRCQAVPGSDCMRGHLMRNR